MDIIRDDILQATAVDNERLEIFGTKLFPSLFDFVILAGYLRTISLIDRKVCKYISLFFLFLSTLNNGNLYYIKRTSKHK
jgi:hypothetical protein